MYDLWSAHKLDSFLKNTPLRNEPVCFPNTYFIIGYQNTRTEHLIACTAIQWLSFFLSFWILPHQRSWVPLRNKLITISCDSSIYCRKRRFFFDAFFATSMKQSTICWFGKRSLSQIMRNRGWPANDDTFWKKACVQEQKKLRAFSIFELLARVWIKS